MESCAGTQPKVVFTCTLSLAGDLPGSEPQRTNFSQAAFPDSAVWVLGKKLFEAPAIAETVNREGFAKNYSHARSMKHLGSLFFFLVKENPDYIGGEEDRITDTVCPFAKIFIE